MAIKKLVNEAELKTNHLKEIAEGKRFRHLFINYDPDFDSLLILTVSPDVETVIHYIDDQHVALVYDSNSLEIVGLQIEDFEYSFLQKHAGVAKVWRLSDSVKISDLKDFGDLLVKVENNKPAIAREVFLASEEIFAHQGERLMLQNLRGVFAYKTG